MQRNTRRMLFGLSGLLFIFLAWSITLYAFGYRFSFADGIVRTGGLYVATTPSTEVRIFLDGKHIKTTSLISRHAFIESLTPRVYTVRVERDGFRPWQKIVRVEPELVTELAPILVPEEITGETLFHGTFRSFARWNKNTIVFTTDKKQQRFFDVASQEFVLATRAGAKDEPPSLTDVATLVISRESPDGYTIDADEQSIVWWKNRTLAIEWLDNDIPFYATSTQETLATFSHPVTSAVFYPRRDALILSRSNRIVVFELDGRGGHMEHIIYTGKAPMVLLMEPTSREIFILDDGILIKMPVAT